MEGTAERAARQPGKWTVLRLTSLYEGAEALESEEPTKAWVPIVSGIEATTRKAALKAAAPKVGLSNEDPSAVLLAIPDVDIATQQKVSVKVREPEVVFD